MRTAYSGFPAEDVAVETEPILRQIEAALKQYVLLQGAGVVCGEKQEKKKEVSRKETDSLHQKGVLTSQEVRFLRDEGSAKGISSSRRVARLGTLTNYKTLGVRKLLEEFTKIFVPLFVRGTENLRTEKENRNGIVLHNLTVLRVQIDQGPFMHTHIVPALHFL